MADATVAPVKTVVVADDTAFVRDRFRAAVESGGHRAIVVRTAAELLRAVRSRTPSVDLLVLDLRLPQGHGVAMLRAVRAAHEHPPPIVVFSGTIASAEEARDLERLGVAGYINEYAAPQHILPALAPHLFPDAYSRRASPRVNLAIAVTYRFGSVVASALTRNISSGGLALRTSSSLKVADVLKVRFRLPGGAKEIEADARVSWIAPGNGMGLQFTRVTDADRESIDHWVGRHFFSNRKA